MLILKKDSSSKRSLADLCKTRLGIDGTKESQAEYRRIRSELKIGCGDIINLECSWTSQDSTKRNEAVKAAVANVPEYHFCTLIIAHSRLKKSLTLARDLLMLICQDNSRNANTMKRAAAAANGGNKLRMKGNNSASKQSDKKSIQFLEGTSFARFDSYGSNEKDNPRC